MGHDDVRAAVRYDRREIGYYPGGSAPVLAVQQGDEPMSGETIRFLAPLPPRGLRRNSETRNDGYLRQLKREYSEAVWAAWYEDAVLNGTRILSAPAWERVHLALTWRSVRQPPDVDNVAGTCKVLIDILRCQQPQDSKDSGRYWLGLIANDDPACVLSVTPQVEKLHPSRREAEGVLVTIRRAE